MATIFTDGSSRGNPGPGGWGAIVISGLTSESASDATVAELGGREDYTTNNRMELVAVIEALQYVTQKQSRGEAIHINSDSSYVINGMVKWVHSWAKKKWLTSQKKEVLNRDLWEKLTTISRAVEEKSGAVISWQYVGGHAGIAGNERCDEIATSYADDISVRLFSGLLSEYPVQDILDVPDNSKAKLKSKVKSKSKFRSKAPAYSYVSSIDGIIKTHKTWQECEARVKGVPGAFYKKALNADEERDIMQNLEIF